MDGRNLFNVKTLKGRQGGISKMQGREKGKFLSKLLSGYDTADSVVLPEHDLLATILTTGISEAAGHSLGNCRTSYKRRKIMQEEAQAWIDSDDIYIDVKSGISFGYICEALSFNRHAIRSALKNGKISNSFATHFRNREQKGRQKKINEEVH